MGWLWSSSGEEVVSRSYTGASNGNECKRNGIALSDEQRTRIFGKPNSLQAADEARDVRAEKDFESFWSSLSEQEAARIKGVRDKPSQAPVEEQTVEPTNHDRIKADGSLDISPSALYPRTMVCRQAFDHAFYCQSLGGKFNDIYRYGSIQSCSEQWGAFWFCMRTKQLPAPERERQIREYYASREERKLKECGNSEDIWQIREKPVEKAFWKDPDVDE